VLGVNLMGVAHGVRVFTPMMLEPRSADPSYEGHIVNTASDGRPAERRRTWASTTSASTPW
jgi:NAD(P)-dependent dehydrogenase (short-subunit alcohol dehydrogenase family)